MSDLPPPPASSPPPPPPPSSSLPPMGPGPVDPRSAVTGPAYGLMAVGAIYLLYAAFVGIMGMIGTGAGMLGGGAGRFQMLSSGIGTIIQVLINLVIAGVVLFGGMQMLKLRNYNLALAASIVAMLPCGYCCCVGLAIGIWSLMVLMKPEVKAAFTQ